MHPTRVVAGAALLGLLLSSRIVADELDRGEYWDVVRLYGHGQRDEAVARLVPTNDAKFDVRLAELRKELQVAKHCSACAGADHVRLLRAAVMLHADADELERRVPARPSAGHLYFTEERFGCPGRDAWIAGQYARLLAELPDRGEFARSFFVYMAQRSQQADCTDAAVRWAQDGLRRFPKDAQLFFALGTIIEQAATQAEVLPVDQVNSLPLGERQRALDEARHRDQRLREASSSLRAALAAQASHAGAQLHLGRVLWRLGKLQEALPMLEGAAASAKDVESRYLAHLFLGRVHEDAARLDQALVQYRLAVGLEPQAQSAGFALSNALQQNGDRADALRALSDTVVHAGHRTRSDPYWGYGWADAVHVEDLGGRLRGEAQIE